MLLKVTEPTRGSSPNSHVTSSSPGVNAATLAALGGLGSLLSSPLLQLGGLQALQSQHASLQQLQQFAMFQPHSQGTPGSQLPPQAQFFLQNQVIITTINYYY